MPHKVNTLGILQLLEDKWSKYYTEVFVEGARLRHLLEVSILARLLVAGTSASRLFVLFAAVLGLKGMVAKVGFHTKKKSSRFPSRV